MPYGWRCSVGWSPGSGRLPLGKKLPYQTGSRMGRMDLQGSPQDCNAHCMVQFLGLELAAQSERLRRNRLDVTHEFQRHSGDVGSPEVMGESCGGPSIYLCCSFFRRNHAVADNAFSQWPRGLSGSGI